MNRPLHNFISRCKSCEREGLLNWNPSFGEYCNACNPHQQTQAANRADKRSPRVNRNKLSAEAIEAVFAANPGLRSTIQTMSAGEAFRSLLQLSSRK